jgi:hypothetical protein
VRSSRTGIAAISRSSTPNMAASGSSAMTRMPRQAKGRVAFPVPAPISTAVPTGPAA